MEALGTALLTNEIPAPRAVTTIVSREAIADALRGTSPELYLDLEQGEERTTVGIAWTHDELERLLDHANGDDILFSFDRDELQLAFDDVEAHGLREKALVFTIAVAGAIGSSAAIANAAPVIERGGDGAASVATVQALAANSAAAITSNAHTPGLQTGDETSTPAASSVRIAAQDSGVVSNAHTPGVQLGAGETMASAAAVKLSTEPSPAVSDAAVSNAHTPGLQLGAGETMADAAAVKLSTEPQPAVSDAAVSNVHTPGLQIGPGESAATAPAVKVSVGSSNSEFLGIDSRDATDALIAGGVLLAIAGATFAGTRRPGSARPA